MLFTTETIKQNEINEMDNFFSEFENTEIQTKEETEDKTSVAKYLTSLVTSCYQKSVSDIANTKVGNKITRKRNFQQVMQESFFYGSNRFGNNFIA